MMGTEPDIGLEEGEDLSGSLTDAGVTEAAQVAEATLGWSVKFEGAAGRRRGHGRNWWRRVRERDQSYEDEGE